VQVEAVLRSLHGDAFGQYLIENVLIASPITLGPVVTANPPARMYQHDVFRNRAEFSQFLELTGLPGFASAVIALANLQTYMAAPPRAA
jgi:hypothetical protein